MGKLQVCVVSPDSVLFDGPAVSIVAPAWDGKVGILAGHAPMIALLGSGDLSIDLPGGGSRRFFVAGGVLKVEGPELMVLTEFGSTETPEELPVGEKFTVDGIWDAMNTTD